MNWLRLSIYIFTSVTCIKFLLLFMFLFLFRFVSQMASICLRTIPTTMNEREVPRCVFVCHVTTRQTTSMQFPQCSSSSLLFLCPPAPLSNALKCEAQKAKPEIINKLNPIFMTRCRHHHQQAAEWEVLWSDGFHRRKASFLSFFPRSCYLMQKRKNGEEEEEENENFHHKRKALCFIVLFPLKIRSLMKSYCYSIFI